MKASCQRIGPAAGYDFGNKRHYRRNIWNTFRTSAYWHPQATAMLMPSIEGDEIDVALSKGFRERNLHIVDQNPAIVATLKRRYPRLHAYGVPLVRATERLPELTFANLDLCASWGKPLAATIEEFAEAQRVPCGLVAVTILRGRESRHVRDLMRTKNENDTMREVLMHVTLSRPVTFMNGGNPIVYPLNMVATLRTGQYRSVAGRQTMLWMIFDVHAQPCMCLGCAELVFARVRWSPQQWQEAVAYCFDVDKAQLVEEAIQRIKVMVRKTISPSVYWHALARIRENQHGTAHEFLAVPSLSQLGNP